MSSRETLVRIVAAGTFFAFAAQVQGGQAVVNANQHRTDENLGCGYSPPGSPPCLEADTPPIPTLGNSNYVSANSYHVGTDCQEVQARCNYRALSKPKIISSDIACVDPDVAKDWIRDVVQDSHHALGMVHYEHFDPCLSLKATKGLFIGGLDTIPADDFCGSEPPAGSRWATSSREMLDWIAGYDGASPLSQNGQLLRSGGKLQWKTGSLAADKRLIGYGFMGALAAGDRLDIPLYLAALRAKNVNLTRVWAFEQWTALAVDRDPGTVVSEGPTPFAGALWDGSKYNLESPSSYFYTRLREFAQAGADRGIVVQLSVFDKHGLICHQENRPGQYRDSPFRDVNNDPQWFLENTIPSCTCPASAACSGPVDEPTVSCVPLDSFVRTSVFPEIRPIQVQYLRRVGEEVGGVGNMMFEIINEARRDTDWANDEDGDGTPDGTEWQIEMAKQIRLSAPLANSPSAFNVTRDAFNGEEERALAGKASDVSGATWLVSGTSNAKVVVEARESGGAGSARILGHVTSQGQAPEMTGTLPFNGDATWTKLHVRADVTCSSGQIQLGATASNGQAIWVVFDSCRPSGQGDWPSTSIRAYKGTVSLPVLLGVTNGVAQAPSNNVRLKITKDAAGNSIASVFVDGEPKLQNLGAGAFPAFVSAFFKGSNGANPYPQGVAEIDNFEAARFCDDTARSCMP